jgi:hypothetical protein
MDALTCPRHPGTETYLRCSSCESPICPDCWTEAAVGYHCPDCAGSRGEPARAARGRSLFGAGGGAGPSAGPLAEGQRLPTPVAVRAVAVGLVASLLGGLILGPVLSQGTLFLLSSGALGWGVARAVYWATGEVSSPFVRAVALTAAGFTVAVGLITAGMPNAPGGLLFLAYPAAVYGGWIVVRQR